MSEYSDNKLGQIQIADEVIAIIAGAAAAEVDGVIAVAGATVESIAGLFGKKNLAKGIKVFVEDGEASIEVEIAVKYGTKLRAAAEEVQTKVKNAVETMTGKMLSAFCFSWIFLIMKRLITAKKYFLMKILILEAAIWIT